MTRLHITAEGQTEERFVKDCLAGHLAQFQVYADVRLVKTGENKAANIICRGGFRRKNAYKTVKEDITRWIREDKDPGCYFTTMFDYYALPEDFPGFSEAQKLSDKYKQIEMIENALKDDIPSRRFIPYIQLHEFEALIFADPRALECVYLEHEKAIKELVAISNAGNPELIDNGPQTAPSKRIITLIPEHEDNKPTGAMIVQNIGIARLKERCRHFSEWLGRLESLNPKN